jgi:hypothetical protein
LGIKSLSAVEKTETHQQHIVSCWMPQPMASSPKEKEIYRAAVTGIPRIVEVIASLPTKRQAEALEAAERGYRQTILDSGFAQPTAAKMVTALMRRLQRQVAKRGSVRDKVLRALQQELLDPKPGPDETQIPTAKRKRRRLPKSAPATEPSPVQDESRHDARQKKAPLAPSAK